MGGDGGSVAKRSEIVRSSAVSSEKAPEFGTVCMLSGAPLEDPVVCDWRGRVYNKTSVLELLLGRLTSTSNSDLTSVRDVCEIKERAIIDGKWCCPLTERPVSSQRTVVVPDCGHALAERKIVLATEGACPICERSYSDTILLNAHVPEDLAKARHRIQWLEERGLTHSLRKSSTRTKQSLSQKRKLSKEAIESSTIKRKNSGGISKS